MRRIVDRRLNPKGKSLGNRQRFLKRARAQLRKAVDDAVKERSVGDMGKGQKVTIPTDGVSEPRFRLDPKTGSRSTVHPGNKEFSEGDRIRKPRGGRGQGAGKQASDSGDSEDAFQFMLSQDELLDIFFEDLELPNLAKTRLKETVAWESRRAGVTTGGSPSNINLIRTMRNAQGRRLALGRPKTHEIEALKARLFKLEKLANPSSDEHAERKQVLAELEALEAKRRWAPFLDPIDVRYNAFERKPVEASAAAMFCLMDVSGSMGEREKDLAKRFYMLLHLFLTRRYRRVELVFIRHTHVAQEVDEETFFYARQSGGTVVSSALEAMIDIREDRFPVDQWNIYVAQASDGYTQQGDARRCVELLEGDILPVCRHYAYVEILDERELTVFSDDSSGAELWRAYRTLAEREDHFALARVARRQDIFPVFRSLFAPKREAA